MEAPVDVQSLGGRDVSSERAHGSRIPHVEQWSDSASGGTEARREGVIILAHVIVMVVWQSMNSGVWSGTIIVVRHAGEAWSMRCSKPT